jgi:hypothetical protein
MDASGNNSVSLLGVFEWRWSTQQGLWFIPSPSIASYLIGVSGLEFK